jgi:hypothetical protein
VPSSKPALLSWWQKFRKLPQGHQDTKLSLRPILAVAFSYFKLRHYSPPLKNSMVGVKTPTKHVALKRFNDASRITCMKFNGLEVTLIALKARHSSGFNTPVPFTSPGF